MIDVYTGTMDGYNYGSITRLQRQQNRHYRAPKGRIKNVKIEYFNFSIFAFSYT